MEKDAASQSINIYMEEIINNCVNKTKGISTGRSRIECIWFADDKVIFAGNEKEL